MFGGGGFFSGLGIGGQASSNSAAPAKQDLAIPAAPSRQVAKQVVVEFNELDNVYVPIDPDIRAYQSTADLDNRLAERGFDGRRTWDHVTLDEVAREMDELKMDKDVDENIIADIQKSFETLTKATVMGKDKEPRKQLTPARLTEIENRLNNDPSLQLDADDAAAMAADNIDGHAAEEVKKKLVRTYARIKKTSYDLSSVVTHNIEKRINTLREK